MEADIGRILIPRQTIARRVCELADEIAATYGDHASGLVLVPILSGSLIFVADLMRCLPFVMRIAVLSVSSYRGKTTRAGQAAITNGLPPDLRGRHILVVDDILDTGNTLRLVMGRLGEQQPASLRMCVLLRKKTKAPPDLKPDFLGFDIDDVFVVGYGLDFNDMYRNWPDIAVLRPELYQ